MNQKWNGYEWWDSPNKEKENRNGDRRNAAFCILLIILGIACNSSTPHRTYILKHMQFFFRHSNSHLKIIDCQTIAEIYLSNFVDYNVTVLIKRLSSSLIDKFHQAPRTLQQIYWLNYSISFAVAENAKKNQKNCWQITESKSLILIRWLFHSLKHFAQFFNAYTRFFSWFSVCWFWCCSDDEIFFTGRGRHRWHIDMRSHILVGS